MTLIPYIRQSRTKEGSISIEAQEKDIRRWAKANGVKLAEPVIERSVSGSKDWRSRALGEVIGRIESDEAAGVIVAFQDRLSRENGRATAEVWEALDKAGARLVAANEGLDTATGDHEMLFTIKAAIAREQWKRFAKNWDTAKDEAIARGVHISGAVPVGYTRAKRGAKLTKNEHAPVIAKGFNMRADGASIAKIAAMLDAAIPGGPTKRGYWNHRTVSTMLRREVYTGQASQGTRVKEYDASEDAATRTHEPIIDRRTFDKAQAVSQARAGLDRSARPVKSLLGGLIKCATCGSAMARTTAGRSAAGEAKYDSQVKGYSIYRCHGKKHAGGRCASPATCMEDALDTLVSRLAVERWESLRAEHEAEAREAAASFVDAAHDADVATAQDALAKARTDADKLSDPAFLLAIGPERAAEAARLADEAVTVAEAVLAQAVSATSPLGIPDDEWSTVVELGSDSFETMGRDEARELLSRLVSRVEVARAPRGTALEDRVEVSFIGDAAPVTSLAARRARTSTPGARVARA